MIRAIETVILSGAMSLSAHAASVSSPAAADEAFQNVENRYLEEFGGFTPIDATRIGDHRRDLALDDLSSAGRDAQLRWNNDLLAQVEKINRPSLSRDHQVDAALLANALRYNVWQLTTSRRWEWDPLLYNDLAGDAIYNLMSRDFAPLPERLKSATARLAGLHRIYEQARRNLVVERVPRIYAEQARSRNPGLSSLINEFITPNLNVLQGTDRQMLAAAVQSAIQANAEHQRWIDRVLLPKSKGNFRVGAPIFDAELRFVLQSPLDRTEIRRKALVELEQVHQEMYGIAREVLASRPDSPRPPGDTSQDEQHRTIVAALELAAADHPRREEFLDAARAALKNVTAFVRDKQIVSLTSDPVEVVPTPVFMRRPSPASCENPGPLDAGQRTFYDVSPVPDEWDAQHAESFLREYNSRAMLGLTIHEAVPGHYVQLAAANRNPSKLRAVLESGSFVEGWAVYAERMMIDAGYGGNDPLMKLVNRKTYLRSVVNALIDQGIQAGNMTRAEAMKLLTHDAFQEEAEAAAKWERAELSDTQLSTYFVGVQEHFELRREAERRWGKAFSLNVYNDRVISYGSIPVRYVRALMFDLPIEP